MQKIRRRRKRKGGSLGIKGGIIATVITVLIFAYIVMTVKYTFKFLPNTYINGVDVSNKSMNEVKNSIVKMNSDDTLIVTGEFDEKLEIPIDEVAEYQYKDIDNIYAQKPLGWIFSYFNRRDFEVNKNIITKDGIIENLIEQSNFIKNKEIIEPVNAQIKVENGEVSIIDDKIGNKVDVEKLRDVIKKGIINNSLAISFEDYPRAAITTESLQSEKERIENKINHTISIDIRGQKKELNLKPLYDSENINIDKLKDFVNNLAKETDTLSKERQFIDVEGKERTIKSGTFGWKINIEKTVEKIVESVNNENFDDIKPVYAAQGREDDTIGNTYIEVDLSKQHLWVFSEGNKIFESNLVSGQVPGSFTPVGLHSIKGKERNRTLKGTNRRTGKKYESNVTYWMPIDWQGVGLHDASWQYGDFNDKKYLNGKGSNGCINLPYNTAEFIFKNVATGTPVVIYESSTNYSLNYIP